MEKAGGPEAEPLHIPAGWDLGEEEPGYLMEAQGCELY